MKSNQIITTISNRVDLLKTKIIHLEGNFISKTDVLKILMDVDKEEKQKDQDKIKRYDTYKELKIGLDRTQELLDGLKTTAENWKPVIMIIEETEAKV